MQRDDLDPSLRQLVDLGDDALMVDAVQDHAVIARRLELLQDCAGVVGAEIVAAERPDVAGDFVVLEIGISGLDPVQHFEIIGLDPAAHQHADADRLLRQAGRHLILHITILLRSLQNDLPLLCAELGIGVEGAADGGDGHIQLLRQGIDGNFLLHSTFCLSRCCNLLQHQLIP